MKKIGSCILLFALFLVSCHTVSPQTESADISGFPTEIVTTYPLATVPPVTENSDIPTVPLYTSATDGTEVTPIVPKSDYIDDFESFMLFPDRWNPSFYHKKTHLFPGYLQQDFANRFVVEGISGYEGPFTMYNVRILECYGPDYGEELNPAKVYRMAYRGTPQNPLHDRPPLEIGKEYLRFGYIHLENSLLQATVIAPILYEDGKPYVYGYGFDFSELSCKIPITDWYENQIWKPGIHDKCIAYAKEHKIRFPIFEYKCELLPLLTETGILGGR